MQINCAEPGRAGPSHIRRCLQDVELCSQPGSEIASGDLERFICRLNVTCLRFEYAFSLLEIEKGAAHFRGNSASSSCQCLHSCFAPGVRSLHAPFGRKAIEYIPGSVYPHHIAMIKFLTDRRVALAVNLVARKGPDMRPQRASVQNILLVLDLDILLPRFDDSPVCIRPCKAIVQIGMIRLVL